MNASDLCEALRRGLSPLYDCTLVPQGTIRVRTPFMYPDGDIVDVFVEERGGEYLLTDYGEALGWLQMQSYTNELTRNQLRLVEDVCLTLGVDFDRGQLTVRCANPRELADGVQRVGQAGVRVADLWFTLRTPTVETVADEVQAWLQERRFPFERDVRVTGRSQRVWTIDYRVTTPVRTSLVFLLSTGTQAWARRLSERVVATCTDLSHIPTRQPDTSFVSLFDDTHDVWRDEDFALVERFSRVTTWSRPDDFERALTTDRAPPPVLLSP